MDTGENDTESFCVEAFYIKLQLKTFVISSDFMVQYSPEEISNWVYRPDFP